MNQELFLDENVHMDRNTVESNTKRSVSSLGLSDHNVDESGKENESESIQDILKRNIYVGYEFFLGRVSVSLNMARHLELFIRRYIGIVREYNRLVGKMVTVDGSDNTHYFGQIWRILDTRKRSLVQQKEENVEGFENMANVLGEMIKNTERSRKSCKKTIERAVVSLDRAEHVQEKIWNKLEDVRSRLGRGGESSDRGSFEARINRAGLSWFGEILMRKGHEDLVSKEGSIRMRYTRQEEVSRALKFNLYRSQLPAIVKTMYDLDVELNLTMRRVVNEFVGGCETSHVLSLQSMGYDIDSMWIRGCLKSRLVQFLDNVSYDRMLLDEIREYYAHKMGADLAFTQRHFPENGYESLSLDELTGKSSKTDYGLDGKMFECVPFLLCTCIERIENEKGRVEDVYVKKGSMRKIQKIVRRFGGEMLLGSENIQSIAKRQVYQTRIENVGGIVKEYLKTFKGGMISRRVVEEFDELETKKDVIEVLKASLSAVNYRILGYVVIHLNRMLEDEAWNGTGRSDLGRMFASILLERSVSHRADFMVWLVSNWQFQ